MEKKLQKSATNKKIAGVLAGIADYIGIDPIFLRLAYALLTIICAVVPGIVLYLILCIVMPSSNK